MRGRKGWDWESKARNVLFACWQRGGEREFREFEEETMDGMVNIAIKSLLRVLFRWTG